MTALTYYGICMNIGSFGVNVYAAQFFSGLSEAPCLLVPLVRLGRRPISMLTLFLSGAACFLSLLLSRNEGELWEAGEASALFASPVFVGVCFLFFSSGVQLACFTPTSVWCRYNPPVCGASVCFS